MVIDRVYKVYDDIRSSYAWQQAITSIGRRINWVRSRNFLVLSAARCGTMLFIDYLNCHRRVSCHGEILGESGIGYGDPWSLTRERLKLHVESYFVKWPGTLTGAKILTYHVDELPIKMTDLVEILDRPKIVVLYRGHLLEQFVSLKLAERGGVWHAQERIKSEPIELDPALFQIYAKRERRMWRENLAAIEGCETHFVTYEELTSQATQTMLGVFEFLGLRPCFVKTSRVRLNPEPLPAKLTNYADFVERGLVDSSSMQLPFPSA